MDKQQIDFKSFDFTPSKWPAVKKSIVKHIHPELGVAPAAEKTQIGNSFIEKWVEVLKHEQPKDGDKQSITEIRKSIKKDRLSYMVFLNFILDELQYITEWDDKMVERYGAGLGILLEQNVVEEQMACLLKCLLHAWTREPFTKQFQAAEAAVSGLKKVLKNDKQFRSLLATSPGVPFYNEAIRNSLADKDESDSEDNYEEESGNEEGEDDENKIQEAKTASDFPDLMHMYHGAQLIKFLTDHWQLEEPEQVLSDKVTFVFNNLDESNLQNLANQIYQTWINKMAELVFQHQNMEKSVNLQCGIKDEKQLFEKWLSWNIVIERARLHPNFQAIYCSLMEAVESYNAHNSKLMLFSESYTLCSKFLVLALNLYQHMSGIAELTGETYGKHKRYTSRIAHFLGLIINNKRVDKKNSKLPSYLEPRRLVAMAFKTKHNLTIEFVLHAVCQLLSTFPKLPHVIGVKEQNCFGWYYLAQIHYLKIAYDANKIIKENQKLQFELEWLFDELHFPREKKMKSIFVEINQMDKQVSDHRNLAHVDLTSVLFSVDKESKPGNIVGEKEENFESLAAISTPSATQSNPLLPPNIPQNLPLMPQPMFPFQSGLPAFPPPLSHEFLRQNGMMAPFNQQIPRFPHPNPALAPGYGRPKGFENQAPLDQRGNYLPNHDGFNRHHLPQAEPFHYGPQQLNPNEMFNPLLSSLPLQQQQQLQHMQVPPGFQSEPHPKPGSLRGGPMTLPNQMPKPFAEYPQTGRPTINAEEEKTQDESSGRSHINFRINEPIIPRRMYRPPFNVETFDFYPNSIWWESKHLKDIPPLISPGAQRGFSYNLRKGSADWLRVSLSQNIWEQRRQIDCFEQLMASTGGAGLQEQIIEAIIGVAHKYYFQFTEIGYYNFISEFIHAVCVQNDFALVCNPRLTFSASAMMGHSIITSYVITMGKNRIYPSLKGVLEPKLRHAYRMRFGEHNRIFDNDALKAIIEFLCVRYTDIVLQYVQMKLANFLISEGLPKHPYMNFSVGQRVKVYESCCKDFESSQNSWIKRVEENMDMEESDENGVPAGPNMVEIQDLLPEGLRLQPNGLPVKDFTTVYNVTRQRVAGFKMDGDILVDLFGDVVEDKQSAEPLVSADIGDVMK